MIEIPSRRGFLLGLIAAPLVVKASSLMKVKSILLPNYVVGVDLSDGYETTVIGHHQNGILTIQKITREAIKLFKAENSFMKSLDSQYDDSFARPGALIGNSLRIRLPHT